MLRKLICSVLGLAVILFVTENSFAQHKWNAKQLLEKMAETNPQSHRILENQPELTERLVQLLNELPADLSQGMVLKTTADLVARYGMGGDTEMIFRRLERELRTSQNRSFSRLADIPVRKMNNAPMTAQKKKPIQAILEDFQVNENAGPSIAAQSNSAIAIDTDGSFVICWEDERNTQYDIYAQRYDSAGIAQGQNFKVNDDIGNASQDAPAIGVDGGGSFVICWKDERNGNTDIYAQRYNNAGVVQGQNFKVNDDLGNVSPYNTPVISVDRRGNFVICWEDGRNSDSDIYAQRYNSAGVAQGPNFKVNDDNGSAWHVAPAISVDGNGNFVICWEDGRNSNSDIYAQRYNSAGEAQGPNFKAIDDSGSAWQHYPAIGVDESGNFVICWHDSRNSNSDIYAQRYNSAGVAQGSNFKANDDIESAGQYGPAISIDDSGNFVICWVDMRNGNIDIYAQRYNSAGMTQGPNFKANDDNGSALQEAPAISVDGNGNFIICWENGTGDIYAQRFNSAGMEKGPNFGINDDTGSASQYAPAIGVDGMGNFVICWRDERNGFSNIYTQRYDSTGMTLGPNLKVSDDSGNAWKYDPAIIIDASGNFVICWEDGRNGNSDIYAQRYNSDGVLQGPNFKVNDDIGNTAWQYYPAVAVDGNGDFVICWHDYRNIDPDIYAQCYNSAGVAQGPNFKVNDDIGHAGQYIPAISVDGNGNFVICWEDGRNSNSDIYAQRYNSAGVAQGPNFKVNDDIGNALQSPPTISVDGSGNVVICWGDERNGIPNIYAQRYDRAGVAQGLNFKVIGAEQFNDISIDEAGGFFVICWSDYRNGHADIYAQRYNQNGIPLGSNYRVNNDQGVASQVNPAVAMMQGRTYFTWEDNRIPGQGWDIFARVEEFEGVELPDLTPIRRGGHWRADLSFAPSNAGDQYVRVTAWVRNEGEAIAEGVEAALYDGDPSNPNNRIPISLEIPRIFPGGVEGVSVDWNASTTGGKNGIFVVVDPQYLIAEADESNNTAEYHRSPLILVPGITGSPLYESEGGQIDISKRRWVDFPSPNSGLKRLLLNSNAESLHPISPGPSNLGMADEVRRLPVDITFQDLIEDLTQNEPYKLYDGVSAPTKYDNLFVFFYDWRLDGDGMSSKFAAFVDSVKDWTDTEFVEVVCHSMGGLVTKHAIAKGKIQTKDIKHLLFFGTPHLGAPKAFYTFQTGKFLSLLGKAVLRLDNDLIKQLFRFSPGSLQLVPSKEYIDTHGGYVFQGIQVADDQSYIIAMPLSYQNTKALVRRPDNSISYDLAETFVNDIGNLTNLGNIRVINVVGTAKSTIVEVHEDQSDWNFDGWDAKYRVAGDGTVPSWSAEYVNSNHNYADHTLFGVQHADLPSDPKSIAWIKAYLYWYERTPLIAGHSPSIAFGASSDVSQIDFLILPDAAITSRQNGKTLDTHLASSLVDSSDIIKVVDSQDRSTRLTFDFNVIEDIPGSLIEATGIQGDTIQITVALPANDIYQISHHVGDSMNTDRVRLQQSQSNNADMQFTYTDLAVAPGGNIQFQMSPGLNTSNLPIDYDGDGNLDTSVPPTFSVGSKNVDFSTLGWHLFSPAVDLSTTDAVTLLANISDGISYTWDGFGYLPADTLWSGQGYWLPISTPSSPIFSGAPKDSLKQHLTPGWHLIGPLSKSIDFINPHDTPEGAIIATFGWDPISESYYPATTLEPGKGYWIAVAQECDLTIGGSAAASVAKATNALSWQLFAAQFGTMPPLPPSKKAEPKGEMPTNFSLSQNYPNPFNPETIIEYAIPAQIAGSVHVTLRIYNTQGQLVRTLVNEKKFPGRYRVVWDGRNDAGRRVSSGIYLYTMTAGDYKVTKKLIALR